MYLLTNCYQHTVALLSLMRYDSVMTDMNTDDTINPGRHTFAFGMPRVRATLCRGPTPPSTLITAEWPPLIKRWNVLFRSSPNPHLSALQLHDSSWLCVVVSGLRMLVDGCSLSRTHRLGGGGEFLIFLSFQTN